MENLQVLTNVSANDIILVYFHFTYGMFKIKEHITIHVYVYLFTTIRCLCIEQFDIYCEII